MYRQKLPAPRRWDLCQERAIHTFQRTFHSEDSRHVGAVPFVVFFFDFILGVGLVLNTIFVDAVFSIACLETVAPPQVPPMARKQAGAKDKEAEEAKAGAARKQTPPKAEEAAEEEEEKPARALGSAIFLAVVFGQLSIVM